MSNSIRIYSLPIRVAREPASKKVTVRAVNEALRASGYPERIVQGAGVCFFTGGTTDRWPHDGVAAPSIRAHSIAAWIEIRNTLYAAYRAAHPLPVRTPLHIYGD
jgi:hypothetical protein